MISCTLFVRPEILRRLSDGRGVPVGNSVGFLVRWWGRRGSGQQSGTHLTTRYQTPDPLRRRVSFRVHAVAWHQLGCYARSRGISRCLAFSQLAEAWIKDPAFVGTPEDPRLMRNFILYYDLVRIRGGEITIIRRRKYVDKPSDATRKRWMREVFHPD